MDKAPHTLNIDAWADFCRRHGFQQIAKAETEDATVYVGERTQPGKTWLACPIESQTHYVVAWALEQNVNGRAEMTHGRPVILPALGGALDQKKRIQAALVDATDHLRMSSGRVH